ncbi:putative polysaccharide biosynthesis protein [Paenibacillus pinistramenti]|uniref:putative polysaccharide biosynthesis protein n=1 Tax=Paenibacillus pinistramenti TaxID=1768003 RepID=UPI0011095B0D|nr:polysaccharide biosynthesis protein [Paenibacillus pinistramenti]
MSKKESFIKGTLILAVAALVARVLGMAQRVPLEHIFGAVGNASFTISNNVYLLLLTVATAGIPSTLSKMVSERYALQRPSEAKRIYHAALIFAAITGVLITVLLYILAPVYARMVSVPESALAIRALAPALLLFPAVAMMRGYFQGRNIMAAGGISQIIEQILRVIAAIGIAVVMLNADYSDKWVAAGASFGGVFGSIGAFAVMLFYFRKMRREDSQTHLEDLSAGEAPIPFKQIYASIFKLSIPIVLSSLAIPAVYFIDGSIVGPMLKGQIGEEHAKYLLGILGSRAQSIAGIPPILSIALSTSLIPIISGAFARKDMPFLQKQITLAMRISVITGMPIVLALVTASYSVNGLLYSSLDGSGIIALLTLGTIFQITMSTSSSILLSMGKPNLSMVHVLVGIGVKLAVSFALAPFFGIYGIIAGTGLCFLVITLLNLRSLKQIVPFSILGGRWMGFVVTVILLAGIGYGLNEAGIQLVHVMPHRLAFLITCCIVGGATVALYPVMLIVLRVIRREELESYPRPIRKLLRPLMRFAPSAAQRSEG